MGVALLGGVVSAFVLAQGAQAQTTLDDIKSRGALNCPVPTGGQVGRLEVGEKGDWKGFDVDICRGIATALLGAPDKVNFVPISWAQRFPSIQAKEIDIIVMASGWTLSRDTEIGLDFSMPYFFGGLQFLVRADSGIASAEELDGGTICAVTGTTMER
jgi:general L-amino acid transport system substrate-binding protein